MTYWQTEGNVAGLTRIVNEGLGSMMTHQMDKIARDAFLRSPFAYFGGDGSKSNFNGLTTGDTANANLLQDIQLGLQTRDNPMNSEEPGYQDVFCVTTPGVIHDLRKEVRSSPNPKDVFIDVYQYTDPSKIVNGEIGKYMGMRFIQTNNAMLPNAGEIDTQTTIVAPVNVGDGAPDPATTAVDTVEYVGQPGATHYITVADVTGFSVGDYVTIHKLRTNAFGVTNGYDYRDGSSMSLRIVAIDAVNDRISFERPILEPFTTDLGSSVYGYVTKARHVHSMLFMYGNDGVVRGMAQPPTIYTPAPIDDRNAIYRVTWDGVFGYQPFNKNAFEVAFVAGSHRVIGPRYIS